MDCFEFLSVLFLLVVSFVPVISDQGESREWTRPFGGWTPLSTVTKSHISMITASSSPISSICDEKCCKCDKNKNRVECSSSQHHCDVTEFILNLKNRLPIEARIVIFSGFLRLKINKGSLNYSKNLQAITIKQIENIEAESYALSQPACSDSLSWRNSSSPNLVINGSNFINFNQRTLTGAWGEITIINSKMEAIESETFYNTSCLKKLTIERNIIKEIKSKSLANGLTQYLYIKNNEINKIKNGAFHIIVTDEATISSNNISEIQSEAFVLRTPRSFLFLNNTVKNVYSNAFQLAATERIDIMFSSFEKIARHAFREIKIVGLFAKMTIVLSLKKFDKGAFDLNEYVLISSLQSVEVQLEMSCDCELQILVDTVTSSNLITNSSSKNEINNLLRDSISCSFFNKTEKFVVFSLSHHCQASNLIVLVSITCVILGILLLMAIIVTIIFRLKQKLRRASVETANGRVMRIYTETECQVEEEYTVPLETVGENGL